MKTNHIVVEEFPSKNIVYAANVLKKYLKNACGLDFSVTNLVKEFDGYVISLGVNDYSKAEGYDNSFLKNLPLGGYSIRSKGSSIYILGREDVQVVYGAYGLLENVINFSAVAPDEINYDTCEFKVPKEEIVYAPAIPNFAISTWDTDNIENTEGGFRNAALYKMLQSGRHTGGGDLERDWFGLWCHSHFRILPPEKYAAEHPDWYSKDMAQLCLTNEEMAVEFTENVKKFMLERPKAKFFQLGAMDVPRVCSCERCQREAKLYEKSGIMLRFFRKVAESIDKWAKKEIPEREYKLSILAYFDVTFAPSTKNEKTGLYEANDPSFIMPDNVSVMFTPLEMCYGHALNDPHCPINYWYYNALQSWLPICKDLAIWSYSTTFCNFAVPLNDYRYSMRENIRLYRDLKVSYIFVLANYYQKFELFQKMRAYVLSQLMQNPDQEIDDLVKKFMGAYYKKYSPYMYKCFQMIEDNYDRMENEYKKKNKHFPSFVYVFNFDEKDGVYHELNKDNYWRKTFTGKNIYQDKFFSEELLDEILSTMETAMSEIWEREPESERQKMYDRILIETVPIKMLKLIIHRNKWTEDKKKETILDFKCLVDYFKLQRYGETYDKTFDSIIKQWEEE